MLFLSLSPNREKKSEVTIVPVIEIKAEGYVLNLSNAVVNG